MGFSMPRLVKANLQLMLGDKYDSFLYENVLAFKEALASKIDKIRSDKPNDKYYTTFSKSYKIPNTNLKLKFQSTISFRDYSKLSGHTSSNRQQEYLFEPMATYLKVTIPAFQGTDHYSFNDVVNEAVAHAFDKEVLGVGK
jgi:hypothetical protein